jgi:hypothetical protein
MSENQGSFIFVRKGSSRADSVVSFHETIEDLLVTNSHKASGLFYIFLRENALSEQELSDKIAERGYRNSRISVIRGQDPKTFDVPVLTSYIRSRNEKDLVFILNSKNRDFGKLMSIWSRHRKLSSLYSDESQQPLLELTKIELLKIHSELDFEKLIRLTNERAEVVAGDVVKVIDVILGESTSF